MSSFAQRYKVQAKASGRDMAYTTYTLTLPAPIAEAVPENAEFEIELVDEGILYRFMGVKEDDVTSLVQVPEWLT